MKKSGGRGEECGIELRRSRAKVERSLPSDWKVSEKRKRVKKE